MSSTGEDLAHLMARDLTALADQLARYPDDASLWVLAGSIKNASGTLALHLEGNLLHYVGAVLGGTGYARDRAAEFALRGVARGELVERIGACRDQVVPILAGLTEESLAAPYPGELPASIAGASTRRFLLHLAGHLMWHLGQVDYHRRILAEGTSSTR